MAVITSFRLKLITIKTTCFIVILKIIGYPRKVVTLPKVIRERSFLVESAFQPFEAFEKDLYLKACWMD